MIKNILLGIVGVIVLLVLGLVGYIQMSWDKKYDLPLSELKSSADSAVIARGKYLVTGPAHCGHCHVKTTDEMIRRDKGEDLPIQGGVEFVMGPLGTIHPANLTPDRETGIGRFTDGQLFRFLRHAVKHDGTGTISVLMPFQNMADEDLIAMVSYLRSMPAVRNEIPAPKYTFMGKAIRTFAPPFKPIFDPKPPATAPAQAPTKERGEYLARYVANCFGCHTNFDHASFEQLGADFAGGAEFEPFKGLGDPEIWHRSPNITPHPDGVLAKFPTAESFVARMRAGRAVPASPMPWGPFSRMEEADLIAIWTYLNTLAPVNNKVGETVYKKTKT